MRNDKKASSENYSFIKETIKEQPTDRKRLAGKFLTAAVCGVIFGACAAGTMALDRSEGTGEIWNCPGSESSCHSDTICKGER